MTTAIPQSTEVEAAAVARGTSISLAVVRAPALPVGLFEIAPADDEPGRWRLGDDRGSPARWRDARLAAAQVRGDDRR